MSLFFARNLKCVFVLLLVCTASVRTEEYSWGEMLFAVQASQAVAAASVVRTDAGFNSAAISAGSLASGMMPAATIANGGGVAASGVVATLQSVGAAGIGLSTMEKKATVAGGLVPTGCSWGDLLFWGTVGAVAAVVAAPVVLPAIGFTSAGISAGSLASGMMSSSAIANGGGVIAGGVVATLQSVGALGIGLATTAKVATVAGVVVATGYKKFNCESNGKGNDCGE